MIHEPTAEVPECGRESRSSQLLNMLERLRDVTDHINNLAMNIGVPREVIPEPKETGTKGQNAASIDNLIGVLDILPQAVSRELDRIHQAINDIESSLL